VTLKAKIAEIGKLLDEFESHLTQAADAQRKVTHLMDAFVPQNAAEAAAGFEIFQRIQRIAAKVQRLGLGGDPHGPS